MKAKCEKSMVLVVLLVVILTVNMARAKLVGHWKLDETSGSIVADSSDNSNNGTLHGGPVWVTGKIGGALKFDGKDDYVDLPIGSVINSLTDCTIATWVNHQGHGAFWPRIFDFGSNTTVYMFLSPSIELTGPMRFAMTIKGNSVENEIRVTAPNALAGGWHHVAVTIDADNETISLYLDGLLVAENTAAALRPSDMSVTTNNWLGRSQWGPDAYFSGFLDDFRIYDQALSSHEVTILYCQSFFSSSQILLKTIQEAKVILKEQGPEMAFTFIEKKIDEYKQQIEAEDHGLAQKLLSSELYFLLAEAEEAAAAPKEHVVSVYKRAVESDMLSSPRQGTALLWLYENVNAEEYEDIVGHLIQSDNNYLKGMAAKAETMISEQQAEMAIRFLEGNITTYSHWREKHPYDDVVAEQTLPEVYFQIARAKEVIDAPKKEIADAYRNTFNPSHFVYVPERTTALIWLFENECINEYRQVIKSITQNHDIKDSFTNIVRNVCRHFELKKDWTKFQRFLDTIFAEAEHPYDWAVLMETCLSDKTNRWAKTYFDYLDNSPKLKFFRGCLAAERYIADEKFDKAAESYRDMINRCGPEDDKATFEFQLCKCLFDGGQYRQATPELDNFIANNKVTHRSLIKEAMLMKGRAHIQLGELDEAIDSFFTMMIEYPETKEAPETHFFVGYCYMLQHKFDLATEAFDCVVAGYPDSAYASRARICVTRIKSMTQ